MNWTKALIGGIVAGIALSITDFILHGQIMAGTYKKYSEVFSQEEANPLYFVLIAICVAIAAAILFAKTRSCWADGVVGGATFGFFLGLVPFFGYFYNSLVYAGYPYYLGWCQGGIAVIGMVVTGSVLGLVIKKS